MGFEGQIDRGKPRLMSIEKEEKKKYINFGVTNVQQSLCTILKGEPNPQGDTLLSTGRKGYLGRKKGIGASLRLDSHRVFSKI